MLEEAPGCLSFTYIAPGTSSSSDDIGPDEGDSAQEYRQLLYARVAQPRLGELLQSTFLLGSINSKDGFYIGHSSNSSIDDRRREHRRVDQPRLKSFGGDDDDSTINSITDRVQRQERHRVAQPR